MRIASLAVLATGAAAVLLTAGCSAAAATPPGAGHPQHAEHGVRGTVSAENGSSWTVTTAKNKTVTVTLTGQTAFGTKKEPSSADRFPVGSQVRVAGTGSGSTLTATRISAPAQRAGSEPAAPPAPGAAT